MDTEGNLGSLDNQRGEEVRHQLLEVRLALHQELHQGQQARHLVLEAVRTSLRRPPDQEEGDSQGMVGSQGRRLEAGDSPDKRLAQLQDRQIPSSRPSPVTEAGSVQVPLGPQVGLAGHLLAAQTHEGQPSIKRQQEKERKKKK